MEVIGAVSTVIGLFTTCLGAYQKISEAMAIPTISLEWVIRMRVERVRFELWGRTLDFLDAKTGKLKDDKTKVFDLGEILQIEAAKGLIEEILKSIAHTLTEFEKKSQKYQVGPSKQSLDSSTSPRPDWAKRTWDRTKGFGKHLVLVTIDKDMVEDLLTSLSTHNDGLDKLLSFPQKAQIARALVSGVLADVEDPDTLAEISNLSQTMDKTPSSILASTAQLKRFNISGTTHPALHGGFFSTPSSERNQKVVGRHKLEISCLELGQPPRTTEKDRFWPFSWVNFSSNIKEDKKSMAIVEWRGIHSLSPGAKVDLHTLEQRRDMVVDLLQATARLNHSNNKSSNNNIKGDIYPVLDCAGYVEHKGRLDGVEVDLVGFVSKIPEWADGCRKPMTLYQLLSEAFGTGKAGLTPSLQIRFALATSLSYGIYQLHCCQWMHRTLTSQNVVFFHDEETGGLDLTRPFIVGLQYSRPDDQPPPEESSNSEYREHATEGMDTIKWGPLAMYIHPDFSQRNRGTRRYRRSDDVYSLGVLLYEVAFWEPATLFLTDKRAHIEGLDVRWAADTLLEVVRVEMAADVGDKFQAATLACLEGLRPYAGNGRSETDPEIGLERDLLWSVVREIEKCVV